MHLPEFNADYRHFRLKDIRKSEYRHLLCLIFWPIYAIRYLLLSALNLQSRATIIHCALDDRIPLIDWFVLFYVLWYVFIMGMHVWLALFDKKTYAKYSKFILIAMTTSTLTYLIFPSCHDLRPESFARSNIFTWAINLIWTIDNPTNIFPSEHVIGALAVMFASLHTPTLSKPMKAVMVFLAIMISLSTVFIKQHSVLDIFASIFVCAIVYIICYHIPKKERIREK